MVLKKDGSVTCAQKDFINFCSARRQIHFRRALHLFNVFVQFTLFITFLTSFYFDSSMVKKQLIVPPNLKVGFSFLTPLFFKFLYFL
ncbi:hypothetical protein GYH30_043321 [Glycine max]|nr:hypothetical protein JHK87_043431 [Glycine soja]KAH1148642.1 hypothetical protein GYH30_043321 [Glycine max]